MRPEEGLARLQALGFGEADAQELWAHFDAAERREKEGHGHARIPWLEGLEGYDPAAEPRLLEDEEGFQRWHGGGAIGYLVLGRVVREQLERPPAHARLVVCERTFPTGMLGYHVRRLADGGLVAALTATSPPRLGHPYAGSAGGQAASARRMDRAPDGAPGGGPKLAGTNPLAIGIPSSGADPIVVDVSMGAVTWGDVVAGLAQQEELVPFGGEQAHKAFALALGLQLLVDSLVREEGHGAVLLVARPEADPVPALRDLAAGIRLPGDPK
jgi:LDH2 family malate/lactate/ureidoglycolate dehydrogenase